MPRKPEIGNVQLYPLRPLRAADKNGYVLKFFCPIRGQRIRKNCGTRDRREARKVQRECIERLLNGEYLASGGAITAQDVIRSRPQRTRPAMKGADQGKTWDECYDRYREQRSHRLRDKSLVHALSRLQIAERILTEYFSGYGRTGPLFVRECFTLESFEYLQQRLLAGDECRFEHRSPNTVNSMLGAVMAFVRFCHRHDWIDRVPLVEKIDADDVMKGRPVTQSEWERMLLAVPRVVGAEVAESWRFVLQLLWESGFRLGDVMDFSWDDEQHIHPVWPVRDDQHPTILIPSTQKNGQQQEIPMLPGLRDLLQAIPSSQRTGWIVNPRPVESMEIERLTTEWVGRVISRIGKAADVVVRPADDRNGIRVKYASAHDLRRGCALRLINAGVSAETLTVVMRHADFDTTQRHYGAIRSAQSAGAELVEKLSHRKSNAFVGGIVGGVEPNPRLSDAEAKKLKALLASL